MSEHQQPAAATQLSLADGVATLTLARPEKHNAFDSKVIEELLEHLATLAADNAVRALVLRAGGKHFCAGADLAWMQHMIEHNYDENLADARQLALLMQNLYEFPAPTIVGVQGAAYGGAIGLIACSDIAIASDDARFCLSEVKLGLAPATIGPYVIAAMGARRCRDLFLTGRVFSAEQATSYGLIHEICDRAELDENIQKTIDAILTTGPQASRATKSLLNTVAAMHNDELSLWTSELIANLRVSEEGQAGLKAFFAKQPAPWQRGK